MIFELRHTRNLTYITVSKDLKWIVTGDEVNRIWIWEFSTGILKWVFGGNKGQIDHIETSTDLKWLFISDAGILRIWHTENLSLVGVITSKKQIMEWSQFDLRNFAKYLQ